ncbi:ATP-grasp domain-containing protein, partial [Flavobacterium sp. 17A]
PPQTLSPEVLSQVRDYTRKIALGLKVKGLINIQMAEKGGKVYVLEANPRSSRTIPFVSKAVGISLAKIAAKVIVGHSLKSLGCMEEPKPNHVS